MKLVTAWFGTFLLDEEDRVVEKAIFPPDPAEISKRLEAMERGEVLAEEEELAGGRPLLVRENRLAILGDVMEFLQPDLRPEDYGFDRGILGIAMLSRSRSKLKSSSSPDEHIIQAIRTIDDLGKIINILEEEDLKRKISA